MYDLFFTQGVAHTILVLCFVIGTGLYLSRFKVKGISLGSTWIIFAGILVSHFGFTADDATLHFVKEFGLILFVFSIGLQVGPGFFHSLRAGGVKMNLLAALNVLLACGLTILLAKLTTTDLKTMVGVMSGAVTNTPGLGSAQQTLVDVCTATGSSIQEASSEAHALASGYAVAYPIGVIGAIAVVLLMRAVFRIDPGKELEILDTGNKENARRMHVAVENPAIFGQKITKVLSDFGKHNFVVSRIMHDGVISFPEADTVLYEGDRLLIVTYPAEVDKIRILFGEEVPMHVQDWVEKDHNVATRRIVVTKSSLTGKTLRQLSFRSAYGVNVTRVVRAGVELVASPELFIQMGDGLVCVGPEKNINHLAGVVGNSAEELNKPNLVPIFLGIVIGVIFGSIPIRFPGIPQAVRLGLAGGPLIIAILLGHFGPKHKITTYTTASANLMIREIGISLFLAAVGLGAGRSFVSSIVNGGYWWILYGAAITMIPPAITFLVARLAAKLNFYQICGLLSGSMTSPPLLSFSQGMYSSDSVSVYYATVYPLSMFLRVIMAQILILIAMA
ncbi:MAG: putative transporter [Bacteroidales bacterium]|nr:putative transporter [Bacteroidales bacterium]